MPAEPLLGEIMLWGGSFAPYGWAFCNGQMLPINQNAALYSLLGIIYGGDGRTTFALPDLRGRIPVHANYSGAPVRTLGDRGGRERLNIASIDVPTLPEQEEEETETAIVSVVTPPPAGQDDMMPPFLVLNYVIALWGMYPSRP